MGGLTEERDDGDIVKKVRDCRVQAQSAQSDWRDESRESYDMVAGKQWLSEDEASLVAQGRVPVVFNRLGTIIDAVSGSEVNNRQEVRYIPREIGDVAANEVLTSAAKWVRDNCDAEDEESDAFVDVLVSGIGWTETRMDYENDEEGECVIERIDPLEMRWDPACRKRNLADAKWVQRERGFSKEEIEARWPEVELNAKPEFDEDDEQEPGINDEVDQYRGGSEKGNNRKALYPVIQHQWYETECIYKVLDPATQQIIDVPEDRYEEMKAGGIPMKAAKINRRVYKQAFICGESLLEVGPCPCDKDFTFQAITGRRDRNKGTWYGLVRPMKDPQRWANKFFSQLLHIINTNAKGGLMMETGATENVRKFEKEWAKADSIAKLNPGGLAKVMPKPPPVIPPAISELMNFSISSIRDTSGVSLELLGMADREQAGYLEAQRTKAGLTILAGFFDALRLYRKRQGRVLAHFIVQYMNDGRLIKVVGKDNEQFVPLLMDPNMLKFDVIVDSAPTSRDMKERTWAALMELLPMLQQAGLPIPPEMVEYSPLPSALIAAWKPDLMKAKEAAANRNPMKEQVDLEAQMSQIRVQEATQIEQAKTQGELAKVDAQNQSKGVEAQVEIQKEQASLSIERERMQMEMELKERDAQRAAELEIFKAKLKAETDLAIASANGEFQVKAARAGRPAAFKTREEADAADALEEDNKRMVGETSQRVEQLSSQLESALTQITQAVGELHQAVSALTEESNAPAEIIRGKDGRAAGVRKGNRVRQVIRGPDGRAVGVQ